MLPLREPSHWHGMRAVTFLLLHKPAAAVHQSAADGEDGDDDHVCAGAVTGA